MKQRLDQAMVARGVVATRSQAESWIKLGKVFVNGQAVTKSGFLVQEEADIDLKAAAQYVSRAGLKLASVAQVLKLDFEGKVMLDVGSSTGGFTDYALQHGARKVIAVEVGTNQLHPSLHNNPKIELHEQTDIRDMQELSETPDIVVIDVSFISLRDILPHVAQLSSKKTQIIAMVKPQFEAQASFHHVSPLNASARGTFHPKPLRSDAHVPQVRSASVLGISDGLHSHAKTSVERRDEKKPGVNLKHKGVIKNDRMRRDILKSFEDWARQFFVIIDKADSEVAGAKGNLERFYKLQNS